MKKITLVAASILIGATILSAQDIPQRNAEHPQKMHSEHGKKGRHIDFKELNLTDAQKQQMKTNREELQQKMQELRKQDQLTVKEMRSRMDALLSEQKTKMENVLTQEQKEKLKTLRNENIEKGKKMM